MNEVFLIGKVNSKVSFDFVINSRYYSVASFELVTLKGQVIRIRAYDILADYCYRKLKMGCNIFLYGKLRSSYVLVQKIYQI